MNRAFTRYQELPSLDTLIVSLNLAEVRDRTESRPNVETGRSLSPLPKGLEPLGKWRKEFDKVEGPQGPSVREARESLGQGEGKRAATPTIAKTTQSLRA